MFFTQFISIALLGQIPPPAATVVQPPAPLPAEAAAVPAAETPPSAATGGTIPDRPSGTAPGGQGPSSEAPPFAAEQGQSSAAQPPAAPAPPPAAPVEPRPNRLDPAAILQSAMTAHHAEESRGRPISLVDVLRTVPDRTAQRKATESYWRLVEALADFNFSWDEFQQIERLKPAAAPGQKPPPELQVLSTRLSSAKARVQDAEAALVAAQYDLAGAIRLPAGQPLPLPADAPHVGAYRTVLDQIYAGRTIPPRAVLIDRTLPIRRAAIDSRAAAVQAATDALEAGEEAYFEGRSDLLLALTLIDDLARQRRAFLVDVRSYNDEIAEYAMTAPTPTLDPQSLASMLIKPPAGTPGSAIAGATPPGAGNASGVERAGFNAPLGTSPTGPLQPVPEDQIQLTTPPVAAPPGSSPPPRNEPTLAPPRNNKALPPAAAQPAPNTRAAPFQARRLDLQYPDGKPAAAEQSAHSLYPAMQSMNPQDQAKQLAQVLCWDPRPASATTAPIALAEYLASVPAAQRGVALRTYWQALHFAARAQALAQQLEQYEALGGAIAMQADPATPERGASLLLVRAAQLAADADARVATANRLAAEWNLTVSIGRPLNGPWLAAETAPLAGGYRLQVDELSRETYDKADVQRMIAMIPELRSTVAERAAAVVAADETRSNYVSAAGSTLGVVQQALQSIGLQTTETLAFLARLIDYNVEIADYANAVLPSTTTNESLVRALVAAPQSTR